MTARAVSPAVTTAVATAAVAVGVGALAGPWLASRHPVRTRWAPTLSGVGRADHVALTFDDGPHPVATPLVLETLSALDVKATFFLLGEAVDEAPALVAEIVDAGHEVAVHGHSHRWHPARTPADLADDVARAHDAVLLASGQAPRWFRPPYGSPSWGSHRAARRCGLRTVLWTAWGRDWRPGATPGEVVAEVQRGLDGGGTILLHDSDRTSAPGSWRVTLAALEPVVEGCRGRGWDVGTLAAHDLPAPRLPRW